MGQTTGEYLELLQRVASVDDSLLSGIAQLFVLQRESKDLFSKGSISTAERDYVLSMIEDKIYW